MCSADIYAFPNCCAPVQSDQAEPVSVLQAEQRSIAVRPSADERAVIRLHFLGPDGQPHQTTLNSTFRRTADTRTNEMRDADSDGFVRTLFETYYAPLGCTFLYANYLCSRTVDLT